ncbi:hypothetical protein LCGC14_1931970 [marine sediment metagenome]|uniref:Uncharacterized protein n=1 Tax=marine sediment metagenome TaxID=412755 RepID=A0A0F9I1J0_9ZZZZ
MGFGGFCIEGFSTGYLDDIRIVPERGDPKFGGRFLGRELMYSSIIVIVYTLINLTVNFFLTIIFLLIVSIIASVFSLSGQKSVKTISQEHLNIIKHLKNKKNLPKLAVGFFHGFLIINSYYAAILIFRSLGLVQYLNTFVLILFMTVSIIIIPTGIAGLLIYNLADCLEFGSSGLGIDIPGFDIIYFGLTLMAIGMILLYKIKSKTKKF